MTDAPSTDLLQVEDLRVEYLADGGDVCVVDGVSLRVRGGEILGLAGESGSGKTTIVQAILRLLGEPAAITGGQVLFRGEDVLAMDEEQLRRFRWKQVSLVMQSAMNALNPVMTVGEQIADAIDAHQGVAARKSRGRVAELLELVGIEPGRASAYPHELSGGMRQRVVIAMALALEPPLVFMDEPTTALDVVVQKEILEQIAALKEELGFAILFITHDLSLMLQFCTHIGVLYAGRMAESAPAKVLHEDPRHPYTVGLMNAFPDVRGRQRELRGIPGSPADPREPIPGCRFHPRCEQADERCRTQQPPLVELGPDHLCACWYHA